MVRNTILKVTVNNFACQWATRINKNVLIKIIMTAQNFSNFSSSLFPDYYILSVSKK